MLHVLVRVSDYPDKLDTSTLAAEGAGTEGKWPDQLSFVTWIMGYGGNTAFAALLYPIVIEVGRRAPFVLCQIKLQDLR